MNGYVALYRGKQVGVHADTSREAQLKAAELFRTNKTWEVTVVLAEKEGERVEERKSTQVVESSQWKGGPLIGHHSGELPVALKITDELGIEEENPGQPKHVDGAQNLQKCAESQGPFPRGQSDEQHRGDGKTSQEVYFRVTRCRLEDQVAKDHSCGQNHTTEDEDDHHQETGYEQRLSCCR